MLQLALCRFTFMYGVHNHSHITLRCSNCMFKVESFLQGPAETFSLGGFSGIAEARKAASSLLSSRLLPLPSAPEGRGADGVDAMA
jgi:hypothetical protein